MTTPCGHTFHAKCLTKHVIFTGVEAACPICRSWRILTIVSAGDIPCGFRFVSLLRFMVGNPDAAERYQLTLLTDACSTAWLATMRPHTLLAAATGRPAFVDSALSYNKSGVICFPVPPVLSLPMPTSFFLVCLLTTDQLANVSAMKGSRQDGDNFAVVLAQDRYWLVMESLPENHIGRWVAWLQQAKFCGILQAGAPPELELPPPRTAYFAYPAQESGMGIYLADVHWDNLKPTETNKRALNEQLLLYRPQLLQ
jgi:hypothetical protein